MPDHRRGMQLFPSPERASVARVQTSASVSPGAERVTVGPAGRRGQLLREDMVRMPLFAEATPPGVCRLGAECSALDGAVALAPLLRWGRNPVRCADPVRQQCARLAFHGGRRRAGLPCTRLSVAALRLAGRHWPRARSPRAAPSRAALPATLRSD